MLSTILEAALRSVALAIPAALIARVFLRAHPRLELTVWTLVLVGALAMPAVMQRAPIALLPARSPPAAVLSPGGPEAAPEDTPAEVVFAPSPSPQPPRATSSSPKLDWRLMAAVVYSAVTILMASRIALGVALAWRRWRSARPLNGERFVGRDVRVAPGLTAPTTFGRAILLPADSAGWSETTWRAVLAHENSHIQRGDFFVQWLAAAHRALFWFSPLAWFLTRRLADLAETLSDNDAAMSLGDRPAYAEALLAIATRARGAPFGVAMARGPNVAARVERILMHPSGEIDMSVPWRQKLLVAALLLPTFALAAGASAQDAAPPASPTATAASSNMPDLDSFIGVYTLSAPLSPGQTLTISRRGDSYFAKWIESDGEEAIDVRPNHDFVLEGHHLHVDRVALKDGKVDTFAFFWRKHFNGATRIDDAEAQRLDALFAARKADQNTPRRLVAIDAKALEGLDGFYQISDEKVFHVTHEGAHLYNQTTGQKRVEIFPESASKFFYTTSPTQLTFQTDAQGAATGVILHQYGLERPCPKISDADAQVIEDQYAARSAEQHRPRAVAPIDPQSLDAYVGTYQLWSKGFMTATREGDHLFMKVTGQDKYEIFPEKKDEFFYTVVAAQITFVIGDDGKARKLVLHQNGWDTSAGRVEPPPKP